MCPSQGPHRELASLGFHFFGDCALEKGMGLGRMGSTWVLQLELTQLGTLGLLGTAPLPWLWEVPGLGFTSPGDALKSNGSFQPRMKRGPRCSGSFKYYFYMKDESMDKPNCF